MIVFDILFILLVLYIFAYCIYQLFFFIKARDIDKYFEYLENSRNLVVVQNKLIIILFATHKDKKLDNLLIALNNQTYSKNLYEIHVAYQRLENDTTPKRDIAYGAYIHEYNAEDYRTKDRCVNELVGELLNNEETQGAFVFLGTNRVIGERYLENINKTIIVPGVYVGSTVSINEKTEFSKRVKNSIITAYLKYSNRTKSIVRAMFDLPCYIDGENFVVTKDVVEKLNCVAIADKDALFEYALELIANDVKIMYSPYIITGVDIKNYDFSSASIKTKLSLMAQYFMQLLTKSTSSKEFLLYSIRPNALLVVLSYFLLLIVAIYFPRHIEQWSVVLLSVFLLVNFVLSVRVSKMTLFEVFWLSLYPICSAWNKLQLFIKALTIRSIIEGNYEEENINSATVDAVVNNGKKDCVCKLDLVSEDGMRKVVFRESNRFIETDSFLRMYDAMEDITYKLQSKGMSLKTCQNCMYFSVFPDGTLDCVSGKCQISQNDILIWNGCQYFYSKQQEKQD